MHPEYIVDAPGYFKRIRHAIALAPSRCNKRGMLGRLLRWAGILAGAVLATPVGSVAAAPIVKQVFAEHFDVGTDEPLELGSGTD